MSFIIHAPNVHQGGGRRLLLLLLNSLKGSADVKIIVDSRFDPDPALPNAVVEIRVGPTVLRRLWAEWRLRSLARNADTVLCFGNLPPIFGLKAVTVLFVQNRYLIGRMSLSGFRLLARLRLMAERFWLARFIKNVDRIVVQSPTMQREVLSRFGRSADIIPFHEVPVDREVPASNKPASPAQTFLYVASGEPHKNHANLIKAWALLAKQGCFPQLYLTVGNSHYPELSDEIERVKSRDGVKINNVGEITQQALTALWMRADALIYPSTLESLGLPLIEASQHGLPIIASELDYVRDAVDPQQTFDPHSPVSIARAVLRFCNRKEERIPIVNASRFVSELMRRSN